MNTVSFVTIKTEVFGGCTFLSILYFFLAVSRLLCFPTQTRYAPDSTVMIDVVSQVRPFLFQGADCFQYLAQHWKQLVLWNGKDLNKVVQKGDRRS